jgi:hypothetical protein
VLATRTVLVAIAILLVGLIVLVAALLLRGPQVAQQSPLTPDTKTPVERNDPATEAAPSQRPSEATIRVSGMQGVAYGGAFGSVEAGSKSVEGVLGEEPADYEVPLNADGFEFVTANFYKKPQTGAGTLRVQILIDGEVAKEQETDAESGFVSVTYSPSQP